MKTIFGDQIVFCLVESVKPKYMYLKTKLFLQSLEFLLNSDTLSTSFKYDNKEDRDTKRKRKKERERVRDRQRGRQTE